MSVKVQISQTIDRPVDKVFPFVAVDHIRNHPRWDPNIELEKISPGPMGVGTMMRRRNSRGGRTVEGTMEVVEFVPNEVFTVQIREGSNEMRGQILFEAIGENQTKMTTLVEIPWMDESMDRSFLMSELEKSKERRRALIEAEV